MFAPAVDARFLVGKFNFVFEAISAIDKRSSWLLVFQFLYPDDAIVCQLNGFYHFIIMGKSFTKICSDIIYRDSKLANLRNLGYKVRSLLTSNPAKRDILRERLNFSENDMARLEFGRLSLTPAQIEATASVFSIEPDELVDYKNSDSYKDMIHCMSSFSTQEHCDEILDIIDSYIDIKEAAN